ncbi:MAG TPA: hypothetical protein VIT23_06125, partial [Terrimicrobiaceae bacterium]
MRKFRSSFDEKLNLAADSGSIPIQRLAVAVLLAALVSAPSVSWGQETAPLLDNTGFVENPKPTWETQRQARTFVLGIPAPRGQITDRHGKPLAQTRLSYNLAISFPAPLDWRDSRILTFAKQQITLASGLLNRAIPVTDEA